VPDDEICIEDECNALETVNKQLDDCRDQEEVLLYEALSLDLGGEG